MSIFEEVKSQLNIRQVVEFYGFKVNRARQFICPFHNDHKPSASIKDDYFNCFVCGVGGDLITFTAKYFGLSNYDAVKKLIEDFNLNIQIDTKEEQIAHNKAEQNRKKEVNACNSLRDKLAKDKNLRSEMKKPTLYKLRGAVREQNKREEEIKQEYINHVGNVLADMHRFLWQGIHLYPYGHEMHDIGLYELTVCQYYIDCYNENPLEFCLCSRKVVEKYEGQLRQWKA